MRFRRSLPLLLVALISGAATAAYAQRGGGFLGGQIDDFFGGFGRAVRMAPPEMPDEKFTVCRAMYTSVRREPNGGGWLARGSVKSLDDWNAERALEGQGKGKVQSIARLHPLERIRAESRIRRLFRDAGIESLGVKSAGSTVLIFGEAGSAAEKELAESLAQSVLRDARSHRPAEHVRLREAQRLDECCRIIRHLRDRGVVVRRVGRQAHAAVVEEDQLMVRGQCLDQQRVPQAHGGDEAVEIGTAHV